MKRFRKITCITICLFMAVCSVAATAEAADGETTEQGLEEIIPLIEMTDINGTEGMGLEEMTDAYSESAMSEYMDSVTGFRMQYPSIFQFDDYGTAFTADGKATLSIDNMNNQTGLDEATLLQAVEQNGCLRFDRNTDNGNVIQTDLYFLTEKSFHHITMRYPATEKEKYQSYLEYMINTMETAGTDLG